MQAYESGDERGLIYGYVLNGRGGGRRVGRNQIAVLDLLPEESLWLHWDRGVPEAQAWLRDSAGLSEFACDLLLEEATRPRLLDLGAESLLVFLRGVNLNPGAEPEDMVSLRVSAAESLGLQRVSATLDVLALYLPKVFGAALVLIVGVLLAQLVNSVVRGAADGVGLEYANGLGRIAQWLVIIISISVAVGQLEVKTDLLNYIIAIVLITVGLAAALALGLGSREVAGQIIAGIYVRELYQVGQQVKVGDVEGTIEEIGTVKTILLTEEGELVSLANRLLLDQRVTSR